MFNVIKMPTASQMDTSKGRMVVTTLPNNPSSQILVKYVSDSANKELDPVFISGGSSQDSEIFNPAKSGSNCVTRAQWITVAILTFVNLINYMDRYTIAGQALKCTTVANTLRRPIVIEFVARQTHEMMCTACLRFCPQGL